MALAIMHGMMGPAGWAKLAIGLGIAGAAVIGMSQMMKPPEPASPGGGAIPSPIDLGVPVIAPRGASPAGVGGPSGETNIYIGSFMGDESSLRDFSRKIDEIMGQDARRTSFAGINKSGYFPGSSAL